jgi:hypothetical protein
VDDIRIEHRDLTSPDAQRLIAALNAELAARYPEPGAITSALTPTKPRPAEAPC